MWVPYRGTVFELGEDGGTAENVSRLRDSIMETTVKKVDLVFGGSGDV